MKKFILVITLVLCTISPTFAIGNTLEETTLLTDDENNISQNSALSQGIVETKEKTLKEKLNDVYNLKVEDISTPKFMFEEILTKHFDENSILESIHVGGGYTANWGMNFYDDNTITNDYEFNAISPFIEGKFKDNKADFKLMLRFSPNSSMNWMQYLVSDAYVGINTIPHHRVQLGSFRPPVGYEGMLSTYVLDFAGRSQLARTFGTTRKFGARIQGDYKLIDYDLGGYSSDTFWQEFFPGTEFIGWANFKPLGLTDGKYGKVILGGGVQTGHRNNNYTVASTRVGYEYKNFNINFEWANANGYNGYQMQSTDKKAGGFYVSAGYRITPKLQFVACYDQFDWDKEVPGNKRREYTAGLNYFIKGQALKLMLDYVFCQNESTKNSHRVLLGTQILF